MQVEPFESQEALKERVRALENLNIVTGQEVATNEYVDGKRVYVKKITGTLSNNSTDGIETQHHSLHVLDISPECEIVRVDGKITVANGGTRSINHYFMYGGQAYFIASFVELINNQYRLDFWYQATYENRTFEAYVYYTK